MKIPTCTAVMTTSHVADNTHVGFKITNAVAVPAADNYLEGMALTEICIRAVCISSAWDSCCAASSAYNCVSSAGVSSPL